MGKELSKAIIEKARLQDRHLKCISREKTFSSK